MRFHLEDGTQQELVPKAKDQYSITTFESTDIPIELPSAADHGPRDLLPVAELSLHGLLQNAKRERAAGAVAREDRPGFFVLRLPEGALLRDRISSPLRAAGGLPGAGIGRNSTRTLGPQGRTERRIRSDHRAGLRLLLLFPGGRVSGPSGQGIALAWRVGRQHFLLPLRTAPAVARRSHAARPQLSQPGLELAARSGSSAIGERLPGCPRTPLGTAPAFASPGSVTARDFP